ncbi:MAG: DUF1549 domain-containing protein [Planctomycetes bacterium]|nr:DUF1549 domain-containing protein [Planctomycetota bacterium]
MPFLPSPARRLRLSLVLLVAALPVDAGARAQQHWAFASPQRNVPAVGDASWCRDDIDRCVWQVIEAAGLQPAAAADRVTLLRRVSLVLTGLPPAPAEVAAFVADAAPDAYERRVDALLGSIAAAEHMATAWLDLARFADTYGYQADFECRTWPWRDWLIRSFHADKPWPRFVAEIVAGDLLPDASIESRTATAFWRLHRQTNEGGSIEAEWRHEYIADRVNTFGIAFLGLTTGCARCHDHKSDPITMRDYYALGSMFAIDESGLYPYTNRDAPQPALRLGSAEQEAELSRLQAAVDTAEAARAAALAAAREQFAAPSGDRSPAVLVAPQACYPFDAIVGGKSPDTIRVDQPAAISRDLHLVAGHDGQAIELDGDARVTVPGVRAFDRDDAFSLHLRLWIPDRKQRAVILHTSNYTEDADTQGYQLLLRDGRLCWEIVHQWPGSAIALWTRDELPLARWLQLVVTYDGSSRAAGMAVFVDGDRVAAETVRDHLDGPARVRRLELGGRDRDRGLAGGRIDDFMVFEECLSAAQVLTLAGREPSPEQRTEHFAGMLFEQDAALRAARRELHARLEAIPELMVMAEHGAPPTRFVLRRGAYDDPDPAQPVTAGVPEAVFAWSADWPRNRLGLSAWLNADGNPLAARVAVDRLWAQCFGRGLVPTPENFGTLGERPRQQVLLDALACDLTRGGSLRAILRRIVCSATFRQSSAATADRRAADPDNTLLARGPSFRLPAEVLRDQALAASGLLHERPFGPSSKPWQPPGLWRDAGAGWGGADYAPDQGPEAHRRSLYSYRKRTAPPPNMTVLDAPSRELCVARRGQTDTPLQALLFWNDPVFTECAEALAERALQECDDREDRVRFVFTCLAYREPRQPELLALLPLFETTPAAQPALALIASTVMASDAVVMLR